MVATANSDSNRGKRVVEVDSFFHELAFDYDTSFELVWLELRVIYWRPTMLDAEHPVSRSDLESLGLVSPLFAKGPIRTLSRDSWQRSTDRHEGKSLLVEHGAE